MIYNDLNISENELTAILALCDTARAAMYDKIAEVATVGFSVLDYAACGEFAAGTMDSFSLYDIVFVLDKVPQAGASGDVAQIMRAMRSGLRQQWAGLARYPNIVARPYQLIPATRLPNAPTLKSLTTGVETTTTQEIWQHYGQA